MRKDSELKIKTFNPGYLTLWRQCRWRRGQLGCSGRSRRKLPSGGVGGEFRTTPGWSQDNADDEIVRSRI